MKKNHLWLLLLSLGVLALCPDVASASAGLTEFSTPLQRVAETVTGPVGKWIGIVGMALVGLLLIFQRSEMTEGVKMLCGVVFAISFIAFASSIVNSLFSFTGALL